MAKRIVCLFSGTLLGLCCLLAADLTDGEPEGPSKPAWESELRAMVHQLDSDDSEQRAAARKALSDRHERQVELLLARAQIVAPALDDGRYTAVTLLGRMHASRAVPFFVREVEFPSPTRF